MFGTCLGINETTPAGLTESRRDDDDAPLMDDSSQQVHCVQPTLIKHLTKGTDERRRSFGTLNLIITHGMMIKYHFGRGGNYESTIKKDSVSLHV